MAEFTSNSSLLGTDPEEVIRNAFQCFDEDNSGKLSEDRLRELLTTMGDRYTHEQVSSSEELNSQLLCILASCNYSLLG